jgi:MerR family transcriptional regulator, light-induced transcriptional regulator
MGNCSEERPSGSAMGRDGARPDKPGTSELDRKRARLVRTIEGEIVPRLVLSRRVTAVPSEGPPRAGHGAPDSSDVLELVRLLLTHEVSVAAAYVETVRQRGATLDRVCLELLAPAARELGSRWEGDQCDFMQVTLALCGLHQLLRQLSAEFRSEEAEHVLERRILLAPSPGEQHTFGLSVVAEFLQRAGWEVWQEFPRGTEDLLTVVRLNWFAVVGLSVGSDLKLEEIGNLIRSIRRVSLNRQVGVLIGGPALLAKPELVRFVGADATAADGPEAVLRAEQVCTLRSAVNG